jgi:hypothetical protein
MSSLHNNYLLRNMAIAVGVAGATGFISIPIAVYLVESEAIGQFFSKQANAQTLSDQSVPNSTGGNGQQAPSSTQGDQQLQQPAPLPLAPSTANQTPPSLFPGQSTTTNPSLTSPQLTSPQTTSTPAQGIRSTSPQTTTDRATGTQTLPGQPIPEAQGVTNSINNGTNTGQPTGVPGGTGQTAIPSTNGLQPSPNGVSGRNDDDNAPQTTSTGNTAPQSVVSPGVVAPATGSAGTQQPRTVVSPGISNSQSSGQSSPTAIQTPVTQQSYGQGYSQTLSQAPAQSTSTTSPSGYNQITTGQGASVNQQEGQAVRALW